MTATTVCIRPPHHPHRRPHARCGGPVPSPASPRRPPPSPSPVPPVRSTSPSRRLAGEAIPIMGFAQMTLFFTAVGVVLARAFARRADRPRHTFTVTTVVLTVLSFVPDVVPSTDVATKATLVITHLAAAAIVIPVLSARLAERRAA